MTLYSPLSVRIPNIKWPISISSFVFTEAGKKKYCATCHISNSQPLCFNFPMYPAYSISSCGTRTHNLSHLQSNAYATAPRLASRFILKCVKMKRNDKTRIIIPKLLNRKRGKGWISRRAWKECHVCKKQNEYAWIAALTTSRLPLHFMHARETSWDLFTNPLT